MVLIELDGIHFAYPNAAPVLREASLSIGACERLSITGANGAGKSTLLKLIVGLLTPLAGTIRVFGEARRDEPDFEEVRRRVGLVFQDADDQLFCPTVAEDIAFGPLNLGRTRDEALAIVDDVLKRLDLMRLRDRITHHLSGGEKRLVTLATVLAMEPEVLLLDEPTNALDVDNWARLVEIVNALPQAVLLVSHDPAFREAVAPRALHLSDGRLAPV